MINSDLAYDFAKIDHSTNELIIKYGVTEIERVPMDKVAKKYYKSEGVISFIFFCLICIMVILIGFQLM